MSNLRQNFTSPIARLLWGSMTEPQTKDAEGKPLVIKNGPDAGKPTQRFAFGVGIPKAPGQTHWAQKPATWDTDPATAGTPYWGEQIWSIGHASFPNGQAQRPDFAWKVHDGDSTIPNKRGKKPCEQEGNKGNWLLTFSSSYAPRTFNANGSAPVPPESIKCGHFVQVAGSIDGNNSPNQPGVYINHSLVAHAGFGPEIINGPDPTAVGFGKGPAPVGMTATPPAGLPAVPGAPGALPPPPAAAVALPSPTPPPAVAAPVPLPAAPLPTPTAVVPHTAILAPPAAVAPPPVVQPPARQMTAKAAGATYEAMVGAGWTDDLLRAHGMMF